MAGQSKTAGKRVVHSMNVRAKRPLSLLEADKPVETVDIALAATATSLKFARVQ